MVSKPVSLSPALDGLLNLTIALTEIQNGGMPYVWTIMVRFGQFYDV